jgi:hypothetical protein
MIFNHKTIEDFTNRGKIFFTGARLCLSIAEFKEFITKRLTENEFKKLSGGCSKCWKVLEKKFSVKEVNDLVRILDDQSLIIKPERKNYMKECYSKEEAIKLIIDSKFDRFIIIQK